MKSLCIIPCWNEEHRLSNLINQKDEVVEDVEMYFKSNDASKYARQYLTEQLGE